MASRFNQLIGMEEFKLFPPHVRERLALHGVEIQMQQQRFGPAAEALQRLYDDHPTEDLQQRLLNCRLQQAVQEIGEQPLPDQALSNVFQAASEVCNAPFAAPIAVLLKAISGTLTGQFDESERTAIIAELQKLPLTPSKKQKQSTPEAQHLEQIRLIAGCLLGDEEFTSKFNEQFSSEESEPVQRGVKLLRANLTSEAAPLREELRRVFKAGTSGDTGHACIFSPPELFVAVLAMSGPREAEEDCELALEMQTTSLSTPQTAEVAAIVLARRAVFMLKKKALLPAMELLDQTRQILQAAGYGGAVNRTQSPDAAERFDTSSKENSFAGRAI